MDHKVLMNLFILKNKFENEVIFLISTPKNQELHMYGHLKDFSIS
jgi:hypothetical protein